MQEGNGVFGPNPTNMTAGATPIPPAEPIRPVQPVQPAQPVQSIQPVQLVQPAQPVQSIQPVQLVQPAQPVQPIQPVVPVQPVVMPVSPVAPSAVVSAPAAPGMPGASVQPIMPAGAAPFAPTAPVAAQGPVFNPNAPIAKGNKKSHKSLIIAIIVIVLLLIAGVVVYFVLSSVGVFGGGSIDDGPGHPAPISEEFIDDFGDFDTELSMERAKENKTVLGRRWEDIALGIEFSCVGTDAFEVNVIEDYEEEEKDFNRNWQVCEQIFIPRFREIEYYISHSDFMDDEDNAKYYNEEYKPIRDAIYEHFTTNRDKRKKLGEFALRLDLVKTFTISNAFVSDAQMKEITADWIFEPLGSLGQDAKSFTDKHKSTVADVVADLKEDVVDNDKMPALDRMRYADPLDDMEEETREFYAKIIDDEYARQAVDPEGKLRHGPSRALYEMEQHLKEYTGYEF